jgi:hypothetical protein
VGLPWKRPPKHAPEIWKRASKFLERASEGDASEITGIVLKSREACFQKLSRASEGASRTHPPGSSFQISGACFGGGCFRNHRNRAQEPRSVLPKIESRFRGRFQDAPARIKLRGFEAGGGGGELPVTLPRSSFPQNPSPPPRSS